MVPVALLKRDTVYPWQWEYFHLTTVRWHQYLEIVRFLGAEVIIDLVLDKMDLASAIIDGKIKIRAGLLLHLWIWMWNMAPDWDNQRSVHSSQLFGNTHNNESSPNDILKELQDVPLHYVSDELSSVLKMSCPRDIELKCDPRLRLGRQFLKECPFHFQVWHRKCRLPRFVFPWTDVFG